MTITSDAVTEMKDREDAKEEQSVENFTANNNPSTSSSNSFEQLENAAESSTDPSLENPSNLDRAETALSPQSEPEMSDSNAFSEKNENENTTAENFLPCIEDAADPANYANIKLCPEYINLGLKLENQDLLSINFPVTGGRKFNSSWKNCALPDGSIKQRNWLVYSKKKMQFFVYIVYYLLFQRNKPSGAQVALEVGSLIMVNET